MKRAFVMFVVAAMIGGFFAGLILFSVFDPVVPQGELDIEPRA